MMRRYIEIFLFFLFSFPLIATADNIELKSNYTKQYTVVKGDTLWDISAMFLKKPWYWPDIWQVNPQIENPHLIYPGDLLSLVYRDGRPVLEVSRGLKTVKLSPGAREIVVDEAVPTIPLSAIMPFLTKPKVIAEDIFKLSPYIVSTVDDRIISGSGDKVYARGVIATDGDDYNVFRGGQSYIDPVTGELLGYEAIYSGAAVVVNHGDPATVMLKNSTREIHVGDRLLSHDGQNYNVNFFPHVYDGEMSGQIISVFDGVSNVGQYQVVVLNRGDREGVEPGHVLTVFRAGKQTVDTVMPEGKRNDENTIVTLPDEYAGEVMVFNVFEKVSYAIVMKATRAIHVNDKVVAAK
jgi:hypothetical protein